MTKELSKQTEVQMEMKRTRMIDLVGLSSVAVDIAPTHAVCSAAAPATCQRWYPIFLLKATMIPPTTLMLACIRAVARWKVHTNTSERKNLCV
jgi:hypothetical protein